ncbi:PadR family transcriptional regulator [Vibrio mediterranei]
MLLNEISILILNALNQSPKTGYDLHKHFNEKNIREVSHQQVYKNLDLLETKGLLSSVEEEQTGKPNRIIYALTVNGKLTYEECVQNDSTEQANKLKPIRSLAAVMLQVGNMSFFELQAKSLSDEIDRISKMLERTSCPTERLHLREKILIRESEKAFALEVLSSHSTLTH